MMKKRNLDEVDEVFDRDVSTFKFVEHTIVMTGATEKIQTSRRAYFNRYLILVFRPKHTI